jgi:hypothetical protein
MATASSAHSSSATPPLSAETVPAALPLTAPPLSLHARPGPPIDPLLLAAAALAWCLGLLVYATARDPAAMALWPAAWSWPGHAAWLPAAVQGSLPSFAHVCALSLATAACTGRHTAACLGWLGADLALEAAQLPGVHAAIVRAGLAWWPPGQFDGHDVAALLFGTLLAWLLCALRRRHAPHARPPLLHTTKDATQ